jgi:hypothetical protein
MRAVGIGSREAYLFWKLEARDWTLDENIGAAQAKSASAGEKRSSKVPDLSRLGFRSVVCFVVVTGNFNRGVSIRREVMSRK